MAQSAKARDLTIGATLCQYDAYLVTYSEHTCRWQGSLISWRGGKYRFAHKVMLMSMSRIHEADPSLPLERRTILASHSLTTGPPYILVHMYVHTCMYVHTYIHTIDYGQNFVPRRTGESVTENGRGLRYRPSLVANYSLFSMHTVSRNNRSHRTVKATHYCIVSSGLNRYFNLEMYVFVPSCVASPSAGVSMYLFSSVPAGWLAQTLCSIEYVHTVVTGTLAQITRRHIVCIIPTL